MQYITKLLYQLVKQTRARKENVNACVTKLLYQLATQTRALKGKVNTVYNSTVVPVSHTNKGT